MVARRLGPLGATSRRPTSTRITDLAKYPELRWLNHGHWHGARRRAGAARFLIGGCAALVWGFFVSTGPAAGTARSRSTRSSHLFGRRRYATDDDTRNNLVLALLTLGEGWHNNHHHYQSSANQGFYWWEIDLSYYVLRLLAASGWSGICAVPRRRRSTRPVRNGTANAVADVQNPSKGRFLRSSYSSAEFALSPSS